MRKIKLRTDYRHFKGGIYTLHHLSMPEKYRISKDASVLKVLKVKHTETGKIIKVYKDTCGYYYHNNKDSKDTLAIYSKPQEHLWGRPFMDFISEVDKEKYPDVKQKYRFEECQKLTTEELSPK